VSKRRLALAPTQFQWLLEALSQFGFTPKRIDVSPEGGVTLHAEGDPAAAKTDPLAEWEAKRAERVH